MFFRLVGFITVILSFSTQNHAESSGDYLKKGVWDPKRAKLNEHLFLNIFLQKDVVFGIQTTFSDSSNALLSLLAEKRYRTNMKSPQKASLGYEMCEMGPKVAIRGIRRTGFPPKIPPFLQSI